MFLANDVAYFYVHIGYWYLPFMVKRQLKTTHLSILVKKLLKKLFPPLFKTIMVLYGLEDMEPECSKITVLILNYRQEYNNTNSLNSSLVQKAFVDERHRLWVGTEVGLNLYDEEYDQFHRVVFFNDKGERLNKVVVRSISDTAQNELLVGTNAQGLFRINTEEFTASPVPLSPEPRQPIQIRSLVNRLMVNFCWVQVPVFTSMIVM